MSRQAMLDSYRLATGRHREALAAFDVAKREQERARSQWRRACADAFAGDHDLADPPAEVVAAEDELRRAIEVQNRLAQAADGLKTAPLPVSIPGV